MNTVTSPTTTIADRADRGGMKSPRCTPIPGPDKRWPPARKAAYKQLIDALRGTDDEQERKRMLVGSDYWQMTAEVTFGARVAAGKSTMAERDDVLQVAALNGLTSGVAIDLAVLKGLPSEIVTRAAIDAVRGGRNWRHQTAAAQKVEAGVQSPPAELAHLTDAELRVVLTDRFAPERRARYVPLTETDVEALVAPECADGVGAAGRDEVRLSGLQSLVAVFKEPAARGAVKTAVVNWVGGLPSQLAVTAEAALAVIETSIGSAEALSVSRWLATSDLARILSGGLGVDVAPWGDDLRDELDVALAALAAKCGNAGEIGDPTPVAVTLHGAARVWRLPAPSAAEMAEAAHAGSGVFLAAAICDLPESVRRIISHPFRDLDEDGQEKALRRLARMTKGSAWSAWATAAGLPVVGRDPKPYQQRELLSAVA